MNVFNFVAFQDEPTHRIKYSYKSGARVSSPAKFDTDRACIDAAEQYAINHNLEYPNKIVKVEVYKYLKDWRLEDEPIFRRNFKLNMIW